MRYQASRHPKMAAPDSWLCFRPIGDDVMATSGKMDAEATRKLKKQAMAQLKEQGISSISQLMDHMIKNPPPGTANCFVFKQCCVSFSSDK
jgi:hypothetical protein